MLIRNHEYLFAAAAKQTEEVVFEWFFHFPRRRGMRPGQRIIPAGARNPKLDSRRIFLADIKCLAIYIFNFSERRQVYRMAFVSGKITGARIQSFNALLKGRESNKIVPYTAPSKRKFQADIIFVQFYNVY